MANIFKSILSSRILSFKCFPYLLLWPSQVLEFQTKNADDMGVGIELQQGSLQDTLWFREHKLLLQAVDVHMPSLTTISAASRNHYIFLDGL